MNVLEKLIRHRQGPKRVTILLVVISLAILGLIVEATTVAVQQPYTGLSWSLSTGEVRNIEAGSPASAANLRLGDVILRIDGRSLEEYAIQPAAATGQAIPVDFVRDNEQRQATLRLAPPPTLEIVKRLLPLLVALCFALFSFVVWMHKPHDWLVILYWLFSQLGAAGLALGTLSDIGFLLTSRWFGLILVTLSAVLVHFHLRFIHSDRFRNSKWYLTAFYLSALLIGLLWSRYPLPDGSQGYLLISNLVQLYFALAILTSAALLIYAYLSSASPSQQRRIRLVLLGTIAAFLPLLGLALLPDVVIARRFIPYEFTFPFLLFIPLAYGVAIYRHNLLQIERAASRSIVQLVLLLILARVYLFLVVSLPQLWPSPWLQQPLFWGFVTLVLAVIFVPLRNLLQAASDRLFYGGWYSYHSVVSEMSKGLAGVVDSNELAELLTNQLPRILRVDGAALFLRDTEDTVTLVQATSYQPLANRLAINSALSAELCRASQPLFASELTTLPLPAEEKGWVRDAKFSIWVPLIRHGCLQGLLLLGPRRAAEPFDEDERRMLGTLAWEAAIASENVQLVRTLRQRTAEVNSLYSQLLESREAERKRLARELHDQIIQELINLRGLADPNATHLGSAPEEKARAWQRHLQLIIEDLRDICTDLRPAALDDLSLALAVQGYIEDATKQFGLHIHLSITGDGSPLTQRLPEDIEICLFRVLQEAVCNAHRHARVSDIWVELTVKFDHVTLLVRDQGWGFQCPPNLGSFIRNNHFGLAGLQERMVLVGGTLMVHAAPGEGTVLQAVAPLNPKSHLVGDLPANGRVDRATNLAGYQTKRGSD